MDKFRADFRALDKLNIVKLGKPVAMGPARKKLNETEGKVVDSLASFGQMVGQPTANLIKELARIPKSPPAVTVLAPSTVPFGLGPSALKVLTFSIGGNVQAFGVFGATFQSGLYGSNSPELGIFTSVGAGVFTGAGVSSGLVLTCVFGQPSAFAGIAWGIAVDVSIPGLSVIGGGAMLLFTAPPAPRFLGYSAGLSTGFSGPLPVTVSLQVSSTATKPLLKP